MAPFPELHLTKYVDVGLNGLGTFQDLQRIWLNIMVQMRIEFIVKIGLVVFMLVLLFNLMAWVRNLCCNCVYLSTSVIHLKTAKWSTN